MSQRAASHEYIVSAIETSPLGADFNGALRDVFNAEAAGEVHALTYMLLAGGDDEKWMTLYVKVYYRKIVMADGKARTSRTRTYTLSGPRQPQEVLEQKRAARRLVRAPIPLRTPEPNVEELAIMTDFMWERLSGAISNPPVP